MARTGFAVLYFKTSSKLAAEGDREGAPQELGVPEPLQGEVLDPLQEHVAHHSHSVGVILLFLRMTLRGAVGFRGAASALEFVAAFFGTDELLVSANGGQMWLLRVGLFELLRAKEVADDWIWILDHTIQVGKGKCFVVVGVRIAILTAQRRDICIQRQYEVEEVRTQAIIYIRRRVWRCCPGGIEARLPSPNIPGTIKRGTHHVRNAKRLPLAINIPRCHEERCSYGKKSSLDRPHSG